MSKVLKELSKKIGVSQFDIEKAIAGLRNLAADTIRSGESFTLLEFFVIDFDDRPERKRRNPKTQESVIVSAERVPKARFSPSFLPLCQPDSFPADGPAADSPEPTPVIPPVPVISPAPAIASPVSLPPLPDSVVPPLPPIPEKLYFLADGKELPESAVSKLDPATLIYHASFGNNWKTVAEVFGNR
ncbi:MAG: HU family DNA-binding protein [Snowella sp.]|nr:HU family DNA-binding protein [Snowella sp.]